MPAKSRTRIRTQSRGARAAAAPLPPVPGLEDYVPDTTRWNDAMLTLFATIEVLAEDTAKPRRWRAPGTFPPPPWLAAFPLHLLVRWCSDGAYPQTLHVAYRPIIDLCWASLARGASVDHGAAADAALGAMRVAADAAIAFLARLKAPPWTYDEVLAASLFDGFVLFEAPTPLDYWHGHRVFDAPLDVYREAAVDAAARYGAQRGIEATVVEPDVGDYYQRREAPGIRLARFLRGRHDRLWRLGYVPAGALRMLDRVADHVVRVAIAGARLRWPEYVREQHAAAWRECSERLPAPFDALSMRGVEDAEKV